MVTQHYTSKSTLLIIVSGCLLLLISFGLRSSYGLFVLPISDANDWGRDVISLALAIQNLSWGIAAAFAGYLADRFSPLKVLVTGVVCYVAGLWLSAGVSQPWLLHLSAGVLVGSGVAGTSFGLVLPILTRVVDPLKRQIVIGVATAAGSLGQFIVVPVAGVLVANFDWVVALKIMAFMAFFMVILIIPLATTKPSAASDKPVTPEDEQSLTATIGCAMKEKSYILLIFGFYVCGYHVAFITAHMPPFLRDAGFSVEIGAWSIALIGLFNIFGSLASGYVSGTYSKKILLAFIYGARGVAIAVFLISPLSEWSVFIFSAVMGFFWLATIPPTTGLVATMFGLRYLSTLYGLVFMSHQLGSFCGVWLGGWLFEQYGNYHVMWYSAIALSVFAALVHLPIHERYLLRINRPATN